MLSNNRLNDFLSRFFYFFNYVLKNTNFRMKIRWSANNAKLIIIFHSVFTNDQSFIRHYLPSLFETSEFIVATNHRRYRRQ